MKILNFHPIFNENVIYMSKKYDYEIINNVSKIKEKDYLIVIGAHTCVNQLLDIKEKLNLKYLILQTEQMNNDVFENKYYIKLLKESKVMDWSYYNANKMIRTYGIDITGIFNFPFFNIIGDNNKRDIDFLFIGSKNDLRVEIKDKLKILYPDKLILFDFDYSFTDNKKLTEILLRTKYVLNIPYYKNSVLETHRINKALCCGCDVISHYSYDNELNERYEKHIHFCSDIVKYISKNIDDMPKKDKYNSQYTFLYF